MAELCQNKRKIFFDVSDHSNRYAKLLKWNECKVVPTCIKKKPCNTNLSYFKVPQRLRLWSFRYIQIFSLSKLTLFFLFSMFGHKPIGMLSHFSCFTHFINHLFFPGKKHTKCIIYSPKIISKEIEYSNFWAKNMTKTNLQNILTQTSEDAVLGVWAVQMIWGETPGWYSFAVSRGRD